jgi:hypothetical protein
MKYKLPLLVGLASLAALVGVQAQTAVTDPVGYITHTIAANASVAESYLAVTLINKTDFAGSSVAAPSGNTVSIAGIPAGLSNASLLEIKSGANAGWWSSVVSSVDGTATLLDTLPAGLPAGTAITIRKHMTIGGFLGATNSAGLKPGTSPADADEVQVLDNSANPQAVSSYFYVAGLAPAVPDGWYDGGANPAQDVVLVPGSAVKVVHKTATPLSLVSVGYVKTTPTQVDLYKGENWVAPMRATGVTLGASNINTGVIATGLDQGSGFADADEIQVLDTAQLVTAYFGLDPALGFGTGIFDGGAAPSDGVLVPEHKGLNVVRKVTTPAIWTVPAVTIAQ